ncbi:hypothetical protein [Capillimicrobium parvum]|uniref:Uncharacterized protein n=1 Tax=Capillimicrobium parvum TaxID=2884022 RepID=A0A9E6XYE4_9ACTN|nr:hypothetical protein [Capillimicrobium parvum]UGS36233.1 hypothetical protein DSM104329_02633 [Capillimicrobium parvum]
MAIVIVSLIVLVPLVLLVVDVARGRHRQDDPPESYGASLHG